MNLPTTKPHSNFQKIELAIPYTVQHGMRSQVESEMVSASNSLLPKPTLLSIPREIRDEIYKYLLTSPILATGSSISIEIGSAHDIKPQYFLHPSILLCCKQLYLEGVMVLYGGNEFIIDCTHSIHSKMTCAKATTYSLLARSARLDYAVSNALVISPLDRNGSRMPSADMDLPRQLEEPFRHVCASQVRRIRKWKVLVSRNAYRRYSGNPLLEFCRAICQLPDLEICFLLLPMEINNPDLLNGTFEIIDPGQTLEIWAPLKLLRNISRVEFRVASENETPKYLLFHWPPKRNCTALLESTRLLQEHISLMKGSSPLKDSVPIHLMYERLLAYAQTFEHGPDSKMDMGLALNLQNIVSYSEKSFRGRNLHPIQQYLEQCRIAVFHNSIIKFEASRDQLLLYLERQYRQVNECASRLNNFIKLEKTDSGFLSLAKRNAEVPRFMPTASHTESSSITMKQDQSNDEYKNNKWWDRSTEALILLERYADSFDRELSFKFQVDIENRTDNISRMYESVPRGELMINLREAYQLREFKQFIQWFQEAVDDMDRQLMKIREARKGLYEWDSEGQSAVIEVDYREFDAVNWDVDEPDLRLRRPAERHFSHHDM